AKLGGGVFFFFHGQNFFVLRYDDDENLEFHQLRAGATSFRRETHEGKDYLVSKDNGVGMEYALGGKILKIEDAKSDHRCRGPSMAGDYRRGRQDATNSPRAEGKDV